VGHRTHFDLFDDDYDDTEVERIDEADDAGSDFDCVGVLIAMLIGLALAYGVWVELWR